MTPPGPEWVALRPAVEIADGEARACDVRHGKRFLSVILARLEGQLYAYENLCPHAGMPLDRPDGMVSMDLRGYLVCAAHLASFHVETGAFAGGPSAPGARGLRPARTTEIDGVVWVDTTSLAG
jgi:nitrite reductase/ring-hydroxylating ferredoxin subunit